MAHTYREVHYHRHNDGVQLSNIVAALIGIAGGAVVLLLTTRFIMSLLAVDRLQPFANFVYNASYPFVAPFFNLFNYQSQMGVLRFEYQTVIAITFWAFATWALARLITSATNEV